MKPTVWRRFLLTDSSDSSEYSDSDDDSEEDTLSAHNSAPFDFGWEDEEDSGENSSDDLRRWLSRVMDNKDSLLVECNREFHRRHCELG